MRAATVKARVNVIHAEGEHEETKPIVSLISFPLINPNSIIMPHYDALVITLCISGFDVNRVLVDLGSAVDLLQLFKHMKISLGVVNSVGQIRSSFNGATIVTLGGVPLLVKDRPVTQQVLFSIIEDLGPYNAIMRRVWLHSMKAIPSTYHQTVSYLTNVGKIDLLSSQLAT